MSRTLAYFAVFVLAVAGCAEHRVRDWPTLVEQVTRWQRIAEQTWTMDEIEDVSASLDRRFYDVPCPLPRCKAGTVGEAPESGAGTPPAS
jgi:hypothetical protein